MDHGVKRDSLEGLSALVNRGVFSRIFETVTDQRFKLCQLSKLCDGNRCTLSPHVGLTNPFTHDPRHLGGNTKSSARATCRAIGLVPLSSHGGEAIGHKPAATPEATATSAAAGKVTRKRVPEVQISVTH